MLGHGCFNYFVLIPVACFVVVLSVLFRLQLSVLRPNRSQVRPTPNGFKTYVLRWRTKTQKYKGALFEQLESGWASRSVEDETEQKTRQETRHRSQNKVNK